MPLELRRLKPEDPLMRRVLAAGNAVDAARLLRLGEDDESTFLELSRQCEMCISVIMKGGYSRIYRSHRCGHVLECVTATAMYRLLRGHGAMLLIYETRPWHSGPTPYSDGLPW